MYNIHYVSPVAGPGRGHLQVEGGEREHDGGGGHDLPGDEQ